MGIKEKGSKEVRKGRTEPTKLKSVVVEPDCRVGVPLKPPVRLAYYEEKLRKEEKQFYAQRKSNKGKKCKQNKGMIWAKADFVSGPQNPNEGQDLVAHS